MDGPTAGRRRRQGLPSISIKIADNGQAEKPLEVRQAVAGRGHSPAIGSPCNYLAEVAIDTSGLARSGPR